MTTVSAIPSERRGGGGEVRGELPRDFSLERVYNYKYISLRLNGRDPEHACHMPGSLTDTKGLASVNAFNYCTMSSPTCQCDPKGDHTW